jgi:hypothetical protein
VRRAIARQTPGAVATVFGVCAKTVNKGLACFPVGGLAGLRARLAAAPPLAADPGGRHAAFLETAMAY